MVELVYDHNRCSHKKHSLLIFYQIVMVILIHILKCISKTKFRFMTTSKLRYGDSELELVSSCNIFHSLE